MTSIAHGRGRSAGEQLLRSAARGGILIGVAVVIGIVLLQVVGDGSSGPGSATPTDPDPGTKVTTTTSSGARVPQEVIVAVYNGSGVSGAAGVQTNELRGLGYQMAAPGNSATQTGSTVACEAGYEAEGQQLAAIVDGSTTGVFPEARPVGAETANCIVVVGK